MALTGSSTAEKIWNYLYSKIGNAYGVAGLMGNLHAESALNSKNLQQTYEKKLGYTDDTYTAAVDDGSYTNFVKDSAGYGLAQWTYWSRKQKLLNYAQEAKVSIGDLEMQLAFLYQELSESYRTVLTTLKNVADVRTASDCVLVYYEAPANQGETVQVKRANYGQEYYDKFADTSSSGSGESSGSSESGSDNTETNLTFSVGDIVSFTGTTHYVSSNSTSAKSCASGKAKVTIINKSGKHPYHLIAESGGGSTVYGWVDVTDVSVWSEKEADSATSSGTGKEVTAARGASAYAKALAGTYKATTALNCRDGAGTSFKSLVVIPKGTSVKNYGYYTLVGGRKWLYIQFTLNGVTYTGFSSSAYLKKS